MKLIALTLFLTIGLVVSASLLNSALGFYDPPEKVSGYIIGKGGTPFPQSAGSQQPSSPAPAPPQGPATGERTVKLGVKNYAYYFPESGSDTITLRKGQAVRFEGILSGQDSLVGCMKAIRTPWGSKVFRPGDNIFSFTPQETGLKRFTCGMGMGAGAVNVVN